MDNERDAIDRQTVNEETGAVHPLVIPSLTCQDCGCQYDKWLPAGAIENNRCLSCNEAGWEKWEEDEADNLKRIEEMQKQGHSHHCACRQIWGDGECECDLYAQGYDPYAWMKGKG